MIPILPVDALQESEYPWLNSSPTEDYHNILDGRDISYYEFGRVGLEEILRALGLADKDDVWITTTTGQKYVSSCITCCVFNVARPSRVLTERCRAILVIHEYGVMHPELEDLRSLADRWAIPLIEDCAHVMGPQSRLVGRRGEYVLYSLSKIFPMEKGGIVGTRPGWPAPRGQTVHGIEETFYEFGKYLPWFCQRRDENRRAILNAVDGAAIPHQVTRDADSPWAVILEHPGSEILRRRHTSVEWIATLNPQWVVVPTNPLVGASKFGATIQEVFANER